MLTCILIAGVALVASLSSGVEPCRKFEKAAQADWNWNDSNKNATKDAAYDHHTKIVTLLLYIIESWNIVTKLWEKIQAVRICYVAYTIYAISLYN